jgi:Tol biopolymer transport system component
MNVRAALPALSLAALLPLSLAARPAAAQTTMRVSLPAQELPGNGASQHAAVTPDGRYVAFQSDATNLVPDDTNGTTDIFVRDTQTGTTRRVSIALDGSEANGPSRDPSISADGRYVAFRSDASNLLAGDSNGAADVFVRDTETGATQRASVSTDGAQANGPSDSPAISADGRHVAFASAASNLVLGDKNGVPDVFVREISAGTTERVSLADNGAEPDNASSAPAVSGDGRYVVFASDAANLVPVDTNGRRDIFLRDTAAGTTARVSVTPTGAQGNGASQAPVVSADGRYVAFESDAANLMPNDTNGSVDVFVRDTVAGTTTLVSVAAGGAQGNDFSFRAAISPDGRYVAFRSDASNLVASDTNNAPDVFVRDTAANTSTRVSVAANGAQGNGSSLRPALASDGKLVVFQSDASNLVPGDANAATDVFMRDAAAGTTRRVSLGGANAESNNSSMSPAISADGRFVAFESAADNLVAGDTNQKNDVFLRDREGTTTRVSVATDGTQGNGLSLGAAVSADGRYVAFASEASNLVPGDANGVADAFVRDTVAGTTARVSVASDGTAGNGYSVAVALSADGRVAAFASEASNLAPGDTNGAVDIFVRDIPAGTTTRASVASDGAQGDGNSGVPVLSADGRYLAFESYASNLVPDDTNAAPDVFVRDMQAGTTSRVSVASDGTQGNAGSATASISADGRYVAFMSDASNLVPGDTNAAKDVFVRDTVTGTTKLISVAADGPHGGYGSYRPVLSADGRYAAFYSDSPSLVPGDTNGAFDAFVRDIAAGKTTRVSVAADGAQADGLSVYPALSADGRYVAFYSDAPNLVSDDTNGTFDIFVRGPLPVVAPYTIGDVMNALRFAAGLAAAEPEDMTRLDVEAAVPAGIDIRDAVGIAREAAGLDS